MLPNQTANQTPVKVQTTSVPSVTSPPQLTLPTPTPVTAADTTMSPDSPTLKPELQALQLPPVSITAPNGHFCGALHSELFLHQPLLLLLIPQCLWTHPPTLKSELQALQLPLVSTTAPTGYCNGDPITANSFFTNP